MSKKNDAAVSYLNDMVDDVLPKIKGKTCNCEICQKIHIFNKMEWKLTKKEKRMIESLFEIWEDLDTELSMAEMHLSQDEPAYLRKFVVVKAKESDLNPKTVEKSTEGEGSC